MIDVILETLIDTFRVFPFLFVAFFFIELVEHKYSSQSKKIIEKSGKFGPLLGGILGMFPQCGFSVIATNLYVTRIVSLGTLISIYLSTSDEMLPILLASNVDVKTIIILLGTKFLIGIFCGFVIDFIFRKRRLEMVNDICVEEHCHCEKGIFSSSLKHTIHTTIFLLLASFILNLVMEYGAYEYLMDVFKGHSFLTPFLVSLIGLIPNCGASVIITELYLSGIFPFSCVIAGLLTGSGVALLVLFRTNKNLKENIFILLLIYFIGAISGFLIELISYLI